MGKLSPLLNALDTFVPNLMNINSSQLKDIRNQTKGFAYPDQADLYHFAELCESEISGGVTGASEVMEAINSLMAKEYHHSSLPNCHGIAIYFPKDPSKTDSYYWDNDGYIDTHDNNSVDLDFDDSGSKWIEFIQWWAGQ